MRARWRSRFADDVLVPKDGWRTGCEPCPHLTLWDGRGGKANLEAVPGFFALFSGQIASISHLHYWFTGEWCCGLLQSDTESGFIGNVYLITQSWFYPTSFHWGLRGSCRQWFMNHCWSNGLCCCSPVDWEDEGVLLDYSGPEVSNGEKKKGMY